MVLLVGERCYKIKKRVDLGFLDFRTEDARRRACIREVELNRRTAPDVYLDVVTMTGLAGEIHDHAVLMRRMPDDARLSTLVGAGASVEDQLRRLARLVAGFHATAQRGPEIAAEAGAAGLWRRWSDNLRETQRFRGSLIPPEVHDEIARAARRWVDGRAPLLDARAAAGHAVDGHGDLLADDIFCLPDHPRVLDCLEFDDRLRWVDVLDDVSILAMDLERLDRPDLARRFVNAYTEFSGSCAAASLVHHYTAYRAYVRAKVACRRVEQGDERARHEVDTTLRLTLDHLRVGEVRLVLVGGIPGSGKSTLAGALADALGATVLSTDVVRRELAAGAYPSYDPDSRAAVYRLLLERSRRLLQHGETVIADATWSDPELRTEASMVAAETASGLVSLECRIPVQLAATRAERRTVAGTDASEAGAAVATALASERPQWPGAVAVDTTATPAESLRAALTAVTADWSHTTPDRDVRPGNPVPKTPVSPPQLRQGWESPNGGPP